MKRLLTILLLLIGYISNAQTPWNYGAVNNSFDGIWGRKVAILPRDTTAKTPKYGGAEVGDSGRVAYWHNRPWWRDNLGTWREFATSIDLSSYMKYSDSAAMLVPYARTANIPQLAVANQPDLQPGASFNVEKRGNVQGVLSAGTKFDGNMFSVSDTIYFFGNSITLGSGASPFTNRFSTVASGLMGNSQRNYGIGSSLMQMTTPPRPLSARSMQDTLDGIPFKTPLGRIIVIQYGLNDMGSNQPDYTPVKFKEAYRVVLDTIAARGWSMNNVLILAPTWVPDSAYRYYATLNGGMGVPTRERHEAYVEACREIAGEYKTMYVDMYAAIRDGGAETLIAADSLHPNNAGHAFMASKVVERLKSSFATSNNTSLYVDSNAVKVNTKVLLGNSGVQIRDVGSNIIIGNMVAAFTKEIAAIEEGMNYGQADYRGIHLIAGSGRVSLESVGVGSMRAVPLTFGVSNAGVSRRYAEFDTTNGAFKLDSGSISLNGPIRNMLYMSAAGSAAPSFNTRSNGTKVVLFPLVTATTVDFAHGVESGAMWFSVPNSSSTYNFRFYGGTSRVANMDGTGKLYVGGTAAATSTLQSAGSVAAGGVLTSGNLTLTDAHYTIIVTNSSHALTIPGAASAPGRLYVLVNNNTGGAVTLTSSSTILRNNSAITALPDNAKYTIQAIGSTWYVIQD